MFGLKEQHIASINRCFSKYPGIKEVLIYGSRAKGNYKKGSDIDLVIIGEIDFSDLLKLEIQIDDMLLPYKIDLSIKNQINNSELLSHIERVGKTFYSRDSITIVEEPQTKYDDEKNSYKHKKK